MCALRNREPDWRQHLVSSGYLPDSLERDLQLLTQAAMSWDSHSGRGGASNTEKNPAVIKGARKAKDLSPPEPARRVGATQQTIKKIEDGRIKHLTIPPAITKALGIIG
jgi:DNA-binding XRE family transcriptional regulator